MTVTVMEPGDDLPAPGPPDTVPDLTGAEQVPAPPPTRLSEEQVAGFSAFYRDHVERVVAFLRWQGASLAEAADAAQEAMIKAYERWPTLDTPDVWVRTVATREFIRRRTRCREDPSNDLPEAHTCLLRDADDPAEAAAAESLTRQDQQLRVLRLLGQLPARQQQVMAWTYDGYTPTEIATQLGITPEAARSNLRLARRTLADLLGPQPRSQPRGPGKDQP